MYLVLITFQKNESTRLVAEKNQKEKIHYTGGFPTGRFDCL